MIKIYIRRERSGIPVAGMPHEAACFALKRPITQSELRLFQNFSFWNSYLEFSGKTGP
jgi:hypothetical protein